jgi:catechol 2,3-dioxygenase-like lactoylglutathione lyase family enzyme
MALSHIALRTRDLKATKRFYMEHLGLREAFKHPGMLFLESAGGRDLLNFVEVKKRIDPEAGGVEVVGERGRSSIYVKDPNGYTLELYVD